MHKKQTETEHMAYVDSLTGICNRNRLDNALSRELQRASRYHHPFSIAFIDIDRFKHLRHFKRFYCIIRGGNNDTYGQL